MTTSPKFSFPIAYDWLFESGMAAIDGKGPLSPWVFFDPEKVRNAVVECSTNQSFPPYVGFAKCSASDDFACFKIVGNRVACIQLFHGWGVGPEQLLLKPNVQIQFTPKPFATMWEWLHEILNEIEARVDPYPE